MTSVQATLEAIEPAAARLIAAALFGAALIWPQLENWYVVLGVGLPAAVFGMTIFAPSWVGWRSRRLWLIDGLTAAVIVPLAMIALFAGGGSGPLGNTEMSFYAQSLIGMFVAVLALLALANGVAPIVSPLWAGSILPIPLTVLAVSFAYRDIRDIPVAASVGAAWLVAAVVMIGIGLLPERLAVAIPTFALAIFIVIGFFSWPGFLTLGERPSPVGYVHPLLIVSLSLLPAMSLFRAFGAASPRITTRRRGLGSRRPGSRFNQKG